LRRARTSWLTRTGRGWEKLEIDYICASCSIQKKIHIFASVSQELDNAMKNLQTQWFRDQHGHLAQFKEGERMIYCILCNKYVGYSEFTPVNLPLRNYYGKTKEMEKVTGNGLEMSDAELDLLKNENPQIAYDIQMGNGKAQPKTKKLKNCEQPMIDL
jgi:hypothetical protein